MFSWQPKMLYIITQDPNGIKIQEETGVKNKLGVEGDLSLSDMPPLGKWRITVTAKVNFVRKYMLK